MKKNLVALFLTVMMCLLMIPTGVYATEEEWGDVEDTFTEEAVREFIPDPLFAKGVYLTIKDAIENVDGDEEYPYHLDKRNILDEEGYLYDSSAVEWPDEATSEEIVRSFGVGKYYEPLTVEVIAAAGLNDHDLVQALLENYCGYINLNTSEMNSPIFRKGQIESIEGFEYLKNTTSIDFQNNRITDLTPFSAEEVFVVGGSFNFNANPIHKWPKAFPNTVRSATHSISTMFTVTTAPLSYLFGEVVTPTLAYNVYYPDANTLNTGWYSKYWNKKTVYGDTVPDIPKTNGTSTITLSPFSLEGSAILEIGLMGLKKMEDETNWKDDNSNAFNYISGLAINEENGITVPEGGTTGQGNSPSYRFGVQVQRYAKVNIEPKTTITGGFTFTKTDAETEKAVAGAKYTLYEENGETVAGGPYTTDNEGIIEEDGFAPGTYYLKETDAPKGYSINENAVKIIIDNPEVVASVDGGVAGFEHDDLNPYLEALWGTKTATTGVWDKKTTTTTKTAEDYDADALLTNKGNTGYKTLSSVSEKTKDNEDAYNKENIKIIVKMAEEKYGEYTSEAEALSAINSIIEGKKLTGDIDIEYSASFKEKEGQYSGEGEQTDEPLTDSENPGTNTGTSSNDPDNPVTSTETGTENPGTNTGTGSNDPDNPDTSTETGTENPVTASETDSDNIDTVGVAKTGDNTLLLPFVILMIIAAMEIACVAFKKKKYGERE